MKVKYKKVYCESCRFEDKCDAVVFKLYRFCPYYERKKED